VASFRSVLSEPGGPPTLRLFRVFGIQLTLNWSWLLLLGLLVYVANSTFRALGVGVYWPVPAMWTLAVFAALVAVTSLYAHELAHALVARHYGIPVRTISLFLLGGMAHITRESPSPRAEFLIALSGPVVSLGIGTVAALASWALDDLAPPVAALGFWLAMVNIPLAIFNLVPAYPLDGGRILRAVLWFAGEDIKWGSTVAARVGQIAAVGLLFAGVWVLFDGSGGALGGLWLILIAWFMYAGATSSQYATVFQEALRRLTVASVMDRDFRKLQAEQSLQAFADEHLQQQPDTTPVRAPRSYAVYRDEALVGLLSMRQLGRIPVRTWPQTNVERATLPIEAAPSLEPGAPALGALHLILEEGVEHVAVMTEGRLLGLITRDQLALAARK
jgi:Zn-dependent protease